MHSPKRLKITDVNPHLICVLCGGYYIDATTIIECLHSFCKSCIVKYLEKNKYCPICDVQIHKTFPLLNIRSDRTLQNIVYKLVPSLFKDEMQRRSSFYENHKNSLPAVPEDRGEITDTTPILFPEELIIICLEYQNDKNIEQVPKRYFHCPAAITVSHLAKLIRCKFGLSPGQQVNIFFKDDFLQENITVMDIAYTYQCRRKVPIHLNYRILELKKKTIKLMPPVDVKSPVVSESQIEVVEKKIIDKEVDKKEVKPEKQTESETNNNVDNNEDSTKEKEKEEEEEEKKISNVDSGWKEVQLQISENGVMSVRNMKNNECSPRSAVEAPQCNPKLTSQMHPTASMATTLSPIFSPNTSSNVVPPTSSQTNGPITTIPSTKLSSTSVSFTCLPRSSTQPIVSVSKVSKDQVRKDFNSVEVNKLSISRVPQGKFKEKGDVLNKIVSKLSPNERVIGNTSVTIRPVVSSPKVNQQLQQPSKPQKAERKPQQTVKYKTLTSPTKQWNPSIDRTTMLTLKQNCDMTKPPRFFKMRNMPRYLGNPASGVKPMYAGGEDPHKEQKPRSPTKLPPPYTPGSPKTSKPFSDKASWSPRVPSPAHTGSFLQPNAYHLLYSGFPGPYSNPDSTSLLAAANPDLIRSMCASTAFHPSLPPSISMLFNPLHNLPRPSPESPPTVQRIPRSKSPMKLEDKSDKSLTSNQLPALTLVDSKVKEVSKKPLTETEQRITPAPPLEPPPPPKPITSNVPENMDCCESNMNNNIPSSQTLTKPPEVISRLIKKSSPSSLVATFR